MSVNINSSANKLMQAKLVTAAMPFKEKGKLLLADNVLRFQNLVLRSFHKILYKKNRETVRSILIFRTGSLGDSLCAIPAIQAIKKQYPLADVDILTNTGYSNLAGLHHLLEKDLYREIINYYGYSKRKLFQLLRQKKYDLVIQLPQVDATFSTLLRDLVIFRAVAPAGLGWHKSQVKWFRKTQARFLQFPNEVERLSLLLQRHNILPFTAETILTPLECDLLHAKEVLQQLGVSSLHNLIAVVVGAKRSQNRWPIAYFKQVIDHFSREYTIILIGGKEENELVQPLITTKNVINTCGQLTPIQSAAAISLCSLSISNDTGPMHLSYAVGTPVIALFSSRDLPGKWYPSGKNHVFRATNIACEACFSEICDNNICMQAIPPSEVISCAKQLLNSRQQAPVKAK
ncbi:MULTISPECIES: glycosyltransferase family 9 protein [Niastella]|uniref:Glycosyltransferase family 9 protein n=1 Tax=Niastella soli TaxID=2821487 RepID=A0ABS3YQJ9_9BACT|nr:glycosyltransferase family 9 protein [Niastella soli]MBO9200160.1 glycosyltransferase family 9 protein [Niastella soli]